MNYLKDLNIIINESIKSVLPDKCIIEALKKINFSSGKTICIAIGKAAYYMAYTLNKHLKVDKGIVITKYGHLKDNIKGFELYEAGHPELDNNTLKATNRVLEITNNLKQDDNVIFLVSGGGSSLFENSDVDLKELIQINHQLLNSGADIKEINTVRKHLSNVKGGRFALHCLNAHIYQIVLSDVIGNDLSTIASGPCHKDDSTCLEAINILNKYDIKISDKAFNIIQKETPKEINNVTTFMGPSVKDLCNNAKDVTSKLGYKTYLISDCINGYVEDVAYDISNKAIQLLNETKEKCCLIMGGETLVKVKGNGKGGRNQELALRCAKYIQDKNILIASIGSDGSDGVTNAAGAYVCGDTINKLKELNINVDYVLNNNDSYHALKKLDQLIITGPTNTNVNDLIIALINN